MTIEEKKSIYEMRCSGKSMSTIARELGVNVNTVKSYCRRHGGEEPVDENEYVCKNCGIPVKQIPGRKQKKFCSDACRMQWWNSHQGEVNRKAVHQCVCKHCGRTFDVYGSRERKYCSMNCYYADRFGGQSI